jgi:uncharacterized alpha-E superfamily protein
VVRVLHALLTRNGVFDASLQPPAGSSPHAMRVFERSVLRALCESESGAGLAFNLRALRSCADALRDRLSPDHWGLIDAMAVGFERRIGQLRGQLGRESIGNLLPVLERTSGGLAALTGAQADRMTRDDGWRLLSVGRQLERLDTLSHALATCFEAGLADSDEGFSLMLALFDSTITYRARYQGRREILPLLHLLVHDTDNPRSLAWVARTMRERLVKLARHDPDWTGTLQARLPNPDEWELAALCDAVEGRHVTLEALLHGCSESALSLSSEISRRLFAHVGAPDRMVWQ